MFVKFLTFYGFFLGYIRVLQPPLLSGDKEGVTVQAKSTIVLLLDLSKQSLKWLMKNRTLNITRNFYSCLYINRAHLNQSEWYKE